MATFRPMTFDHLGRDLRPLRVVQLHNTSVTFVFIQRSLSMVIDRSIARYDKHGKNEIVPSWPIASITDHSTSFSISLSDFYFE